MEYYYNLHFLKQASSPRKLTMVNVSQLSRGNAVVNNGVLFTLKNRKARTVCIAGNFSRWKEIPMERSSEGIWYFFQPGSEKQGMLRYKFTIDGIWTPDPSNAFRENDGSGSYVSLVQTPPPLKTNRVSCSITENNSVEFRIYYPGARLVSLVGDFNNWNPENDLMKRHGDGIWRLRKRLPRGTFRYQFIIDGKNSPDIYNTRSASTINGGALFTDNSQIAP